MIKWFAYIVLLLMITPALLSAKDKGFSRQYVVFYEHHLPVPSIHDAITDTAASKNSKHQDQDDKKKIKEIPKAKRESKPEKITDDVNAKKTKPKRERRPEGMERPPEIPRRSGD